ncbi:MAG: Sua5/YciO/YrdC/YwlC family protein [Fibrobacteres bacterium]|nr:Sua5/YciO/YrdC/YwlC family protein [Fibrobacterota bacterium]
MIPVLPPTEENLRRAAEELAAGRLVSFPTETVYGLGANALDPIALARIFEAKRRPFFDPLIVHIAERSSLDALCARDARAEKLMDRFWPGPLTLVLPKTGAVPELATSGLPTVAVRMPAHPVALALIRMAGFPLAAPSANPFGRLSPTEAAHVRDQFRDTESLIAFVLDGGPCSVGVESTILSLEGDPVLLRAGGLPREEIEALIGPVALSTMDPERPDRPLAPGQLPGHYAPRTRLRLLEKPLTRDADGRPVPGSGMIFAEVMHKAGMKLGWLGLRDAFGSAPGPFAATEALSPSGDPREAAANLFACLHRLDRLGLDLILAEPVEEIGLGLAIMDRLRKAAAGSAVGL